MTVARYVGSEDANLAVRDLACGTSILPRHPARRLALLEKAGLVEHEDCVVIRQMLDDIIADDIAQAIGIPIPAPQDRLLPPRARIACCLRAHPTGLALLISEQTFEKQACIPRNTILIEQRTYPFLDLTKRRRPQCKRLFNRRWPRPRSSNHGCPWIQKPAEKATVVLELDRNALSDPLDRSRKLVSAVAKFHKDRGTHGIDVVESLPRRFSASITPPASSACMGLPLNGEAATSPEKKA